VNRTIIFYRAEDGKCPVQDFLDALPGKVAQIERAETYRRDYLIRHG